MDMKTEQSRTSQKQVEASQNKTGGEIVNSQNRSYLKVLKPYLFLVPIYFLIITFKYIPFGMAIQKSFYNWNGGNLNEFVGLGNYSEVLTDPIFLKSLLTVGKVMIVQILIAITIPLLAAELLCSVKSDRRQYVIRTAFTFPMVVPFVVIIMLWKWILAGDTGVLNIFFKNIGLENLAHPWLASSETALGAILAIGFPWIGISNLGGMQFLIYYGTLRSIPKDMLEAAEIDGVGRFTRFFKIDLPMLSNQLKLMVTFAIINSLQVFESIFILTKGGPGTTTMVPTVYLYEQGFNYRRMGYSSAVGVILFILIMIITVLNNKFLKGEDIN